MVMFGNNVQPVIKIHDDNVNLLFLEIVFNTYWVNWALNTIDVGIEAYSLLF